MAFLGQSYAVKDIPEQDGFEPIPAGWYNSRITEAEGEKALRLGRGLILRFVMTSPDRPIREG